MDRQILFPAAVAAVLSMVASALGQEPPRGPTSLAGQIELPRLVEVAAERLGVSVEYDPAALKGFMVTLG